MQINDYLKKDLPEWKLLETLDERYENGVIDYHEHRRLIKKLIARNIFEAEQSKLGLNLVIAELKEEVLKLRYELS